MNKTRIAMLGLLPLLVIILAGCPFEMFDFEAPGEVSSLVVTADDGHVIVSWTDPTDADFDHVLVSWNPDGTTAQAVDAGTQTYEATGLTNDTAYAFWVKTVDGAGNTSAGVTAAVVPGDATPPGEVIGLDAVAGVGQIDLSWSNPSDIDFDHLELTWTPDGPLAMLFDTETETHTAAGLANGTAYTFTLKTIDTSGNRSNGAEDVATTITVGDFYAGGIVFYLDGYGGGMAAAQSDQSAGVMWCDAIVAGTSTDVGTGAANTALILAVGSEFFSAQVCNDLDLNGYTDWFLPSLDELDLMYQHRALIGGFSPANYWSSSEYNPVSAWFQSFDDGSQSDDDKEFSFRVRAARAF